MKKGGAFAPPRGEDMELLSGSLSGDLGGIHPGDMLPFPKEQLDAVPALIAGAVDAAGQPYADRGSIGSGHVLKMCRRECPPANTEFCRIDPPLRDEAASERVDIF